MLYNIMLDINILLNVREKKYVKLSYKHILYIGKITLYHLKLYLRLYFAS